MQPIPYGRQNITEADIQAVTETLRADFLTQGPKVKEFEIKFAEYIGSQYAVAVANGTAALHLCTLALEVNQNSNIITTPITFAATANCVRYCGGKVWFVDIDPETGLIDIAKVKTLIQSKPEGFFNGIIPVDFAGYPVNLEALREIANAHNFWIIEDACHAPGGAFTDSQGIEQQCGNGQFADLAIFSFHPVKHIATGEGGMVTTNNPELYQKLLMLRSHGITKDPALMHQNEGGWYYEMQELGYNYRMPDILAALGISQLTRTGIGFKRRQEIAARYDAAFAHKSTIKILNPYLNNKNNYQVVKHAYHLYIILIPDRKALYDYLKNNNIITQVHYIPVHKLPYYQKLNSQTISLPVAENYYAHCLSLPMFPSLTDAEQTYVIDKILAFYK